MQPVWQSSSVQSVRRESGQCGTGSDRRWSWVLQFHLRGKSGIPVLCCSHLPSPASWPEPAGSRRLFSLRGGRGESVRDWLRK